MANQKNNNNEPKMGEVLPVNPVEQALAQNNISEAVDLIAMNPEAFKAFIKSTELALIENKAQAKIVEDRNFFKRLFSSSTSDLARILMDQNDVMVRFFVMLQLLTLQNRNNLSVITKLCSAIKTDVDTSGKEQGNLQKIAVTFLEQNIDTIKSEEIRDKALIKLLKFAEQNAAFEKRMLSAEENAEKRFEVSSQKLKDESVAFKKMMTEEKDSAKASFHKYSDNLQSAFDAYTKAIQDEYNTLKKKVDEKAPIQDLKNGLDSLSSSISEKASQMDVENLVKENKKLKDTLRLSLCFGAIALIASLAIIVFSILGIL